MDFLNLDLLEKTINDRVNGEVLEGKVGGSAVAVTQCGKTVFENYYGFQDVEKTVSVNSKTMYRLASMTKPVTAFAAVMEMDRGHLDLFDPVEKYLPKYKELNIGRLDENGEIQIVGKSKTKLRLIHLLTHSSGIGASDEFGFKIAAEFSKDPRRDFFRKAVDAYPEFPLSFEPYTNQSYSALWGFDIIGRIVEETSGKALSDYYEEEIFKPLEMVDTTFYPSDEQLDRLIYMHNRDADGNCIAVPNVPGCVFGDFKMTATLGGAGLAGTIGDYMNFCEMLLNEGSFRGLRLVRPQSVRSMSVPHISEAIMHPVGIWGLGMRVMSEEGHVAFPKGVYGWAGAFGTHFWIDPANKITAVYMKNSSYDGAFGVSVSNFEKDVYACLDK